MLAKKNLVSVPRYETTVHAARRRAELGRQPSSGYHSGSSLAIGSSSGWHTLSFQNVKTLPGRPDVILVQHRVAVFCDGARDFWHGRNWAVRRTSWARGWNAAYWVPKIRKKSSTGSRSNDTHPKIGWRVIRVWESDVRGNLTASLASCTTVSKMTSR